MKLQLVLILSYITVGHATGFGFVVIKIFNLFSRFGVNQFNGFVGNALDPFDPLSLDNTFTTEIGTINNEDCGDTEASANFTLSDVTGLSEMTISQVKMKSYKQCDSGTIAGFNIVMGGEQLLLDFMGTVEAKGCDQEANQDFDGEAGVEDPMFSFSFEAEVTLLGFSIRNVTIDTFEFGYSEIVFDISDLGAFSDVTDTLREELEEKAESIFSTSINASFLQSALDAVLPFPGDK